MTERSAKFTERARKALALARDEAKRFQHNYLGTEHLLVGLVGVEQGVAGKVFRNLGVDLPRVREAIMFVVARGEGPVTDDPPLTPRAERALDLAVEEARALGHHYVGTEHLLLGLVRVDDPQVAESGAIPILSSLGLDPAQLRAQVLQILPGLSWAAQTRDNVVTCRVDDRVLGTLDALVEAGVYTTRSEAAARLIQAGIEANGPLLEKVHTAVAQIRRVRAETQAITQDWAAAATAPPAAGQSPARLPGEDATESQASSSRQG